ncbi:MAG TPA: DNA oxidative demethylase AlkB [Gammaproteobacteria bacterium]|nr:DNA oxidative demethylase AlkB [Gammaproteobacteria bacterium]
MMSVVSRDLFATRDSDERVELGAGAVLLRGFALPYEAEIAAALRAVEESAPFRHMVTPGGFTMSVAMTSCGALGWVSTARGYEYSPTDPDSGRPWPAMPAVLARLAHDAAAAGGFAGFAPDACLVNRYDAGARLTLHQDKDERDFAQPIVSVSLGVPATFLFGGLTRKERPMRLPVQHGDVVVFGGAARLRYHGVAPVAESHHAFAGGRRISLTLRGAG